jgi:hypothetical protein
MLKRHEKTKNPALRAHFERCEIATQAKYDKVPEDVKKHVFTAWRWARDYLMRKEGEGHHFVLSREKDGSICCAFAKPEWSGDHCGEGMPTGAEAIVRAVCEYDSGY